MWLKIPLYIPGHFQYIKPCVFCLTSEIHQNPRHCKTYGTRRAVLWLFCILLFYILSLDLKNQIFSFEFCSFHEEAITENTNQNSNLSSGISSHSGNGRAFLNTPLFFPLSLTIWGIQKNGWSLLCIKYYFIK